MELRCVTSVGLRALGLVLSLACLGCGAAPGADDTLQRVLLVSIDTLRADHVGCYGAEDAQTPTLDGLAERGTRFETAISPAPITLPSHTTLLTGLDPPEHGVRHNGYFRLEEGVPTLAERMRAAGFATAAFVSAYVLDRSFGLDRGFDLYDDDLGVRHAGHAGPSVPERTADRTVDAVLSWLDTAPDRYFVWMHLYDPHADYEPPEPYASRFRDRRYDGEIAFADAELGRLLHTVEERWPSGTLVVVTSDHGDSLGEHGERTHSLTIYDATQHVPLLLAGAGIPPGKVVPQLVRLADVAPTIAELAGLGPGPQGSGRSLSPLLRGEADEPRVAWVETLATQFDMGWSPLLGVRTADHKYIRAPRPELYDLRADPHELHDIASEQPDLVRELDARVEAVASRGRPVVPNLTLDSTERAQLEALGYITEAAAVLPEHLGVVGGVDPKDQMHIMERLHRGSALLAHRRWDEAIELFGSLGERGYDVTMLQAMAYLGGSRLEEARRLAERASRLAPTRGAPHVLLGEVAESLDERAAARRHYEHAAALSPESGAPLIGLGRLAELRGDRDAARALYRQALEKRTTESEAVWRLAALETEDGNDAVARSLLLELPQAELRQPPAAERLARADWSVGRPDLARIRVNGSLRSFPDTLPLQLLLADLYEEEGDSGSALRTVREAWLANQDAPAAQATLAFQLARHHMELERAARLAEKAVETFGRRPVPLEVLSFVARARGQATRALSLAEEGLAQVDEDDLDVRVGLILRRAEALAALGRGDDARAALAEAESAGAGLPFSSHRDVAECRRRLEKLAPAPAGPAA